MKQGSKASSSEGSRKEKCLVKGEESLIKPSDLVRTHYHKNSMRATAPMIQLPPTRFLPPYVRIWEVTIQDEIWVGTQTISLSQGKSPDP